MMQLIKYRVVTDQYAGFEAQSWRIWWPFWVQININTFYSVDDAVEYINSVRSPKAKFTKRIMWKS